jgi:N-acetylglucosamine-6-phosphate deacetylase
MPAASTAPAGPHRLDVRAALVDGELVPGDVVVDDGRIAAVGAGPAGASGTAVPGFVDLQVNGFAGVDFLAADVDGYRHAAAPLAATGVTAYLPTFITSPLPSIAAALRFAGAAAELDEGPRVLGVHLEGPYLSPRWPGAHPPEHLRDPDVDEALGLCEHGPVRMVTLAPELPGAFDLIAALTARGIVVSCGHSDADAATAHAAFEHGATAITHLYNAHRRWAARDPGIGGAALVHAGVTVQAILDHVHLSPEAGYAAFRAAGARFSLISDAIEAAGRGPGTYRLGEREVHVDADGRAVLDDGTLAGSVLTMDQAVRNLVDCGASLAEAVHAASTAPARLVGELALGTLRPGAAADVVVLDDDLRVRRTLVAGREAFAAAA